LRAFVWPATRRISRCRWPCICRRSWFPEDDVGSEQFHVEGKSLHNGGDVGALSHDDDVAGALLHKDGVAAGLFHEDDVAGTLCHEKDVGDTLPNGYKVESR
jgi:hypothetical protein